MNAHQRHRCARRLRIHKDGRCFRHPDVSTVLWNLPYDPTRREALAVQNDETADRYEHVTALLRKQGRAHGLMLWAALNRRAAKMLRHPDPPAWWFESREKPIKRPHGHEVSCATDPR